MPHLLPFTGVVSTDCCNIRTSKNTFAFHAAFLEETLPLKKTIDLYFVQRSTRKSMDTTK